ncbi:hypothetical protein CcaverHIS002_0403970 [Cutaneotrichosporon cavernicola]|uniref:DUF1749-domain-containing protein n=1 Tax=Cutaneotrichosporon cavernicola TaxID=279322 RepID=A0AA48L425_9TREE|nr:uncharacterized protein CcaverHIS019_0403920 [Cutaneotrichosporon cavernicola]BEI83793.1 hypothetical protein CcaverHIS002_0403970 [Cutaneotrichosporon cavernicola]BEI91572.1 hypothetical protein CcaverHIS019_0403920 [Cutaneotrichosporon cavernicola]BEI99349.1 hypothetical protein CcaverHIS631_0403920 [Cutaneotrichosporon cavernicola]BEJ07124.1 hypothetical protein CcaverHIS641_0403930 [Cutaneotrichosporon cavernicola]
MLVTTQPPLAGHLGHFSTHEGKTYPYFVSGPHSDKAVIFIGGLYNGLGDVPYTHALADALAKAGWKLVQFHWTSAYEGFGTSSLTRDASELHALASHLRDHHTSTIVVMGHSTGSQDVIHLLTTLGGVEGGIMQAPVSDREHFSVDPTTKAWTDMLPIATKMVDEGKGKEIIPGFDKVGGMNMSAYRLWSLMSSSGDDDYFSSDLPDTADGVHKHPLDGSFGALNVPALALFSEKDEYGHVPDVEAHLARWREAAKGRLETRIVRGANHAVEDAAHWPDLCAATVGWLQKHF